jgi:hypothetical protein
VGIAEQAEIAAGVAAAPGHHRAHRHRVGVAKWGDPVDHLVERAVATDRHHQRHAGAGTLVGERGGVTGPARLHHLEGERATTSQRVAQPGPQPLGAATAGRRVDDQEGGAGYVRPTRLPPMTCKNSVMEAKRIIGFCRFSAPMVVCEPP